MGERDAGEAAETRSLRLREVPASERPRERLHLRGAAGLTSAELIALIWGSGSRGLNAVDMAERALSRLEGIDGVARASALELQAVQGIGPARAAQLEAAFELGRRFLTDWPTGRWQIRSPRDIADRLVLQMSRLEREELRVVLLNTKNVVLRIVDGLPGQCQLEPRSGRRAVPGRRPLERDERDPGPQPPIGGPHALAGRPSPDGGGARGRTAPRHRRAGPPRDRPRRVGVASGSRRRLRAGRAAAQPNGEARGAAAASGRLHRQLGDQEQQRVVGRVEADRGKDRAALDEDLAEGKGNRDPGREGDQGLGRRVPERRATDGEDVDEREEQRGAHQRGPPAQRAFPCGQREAAKEDLLADRGDHEPRPGSSARYHSFAGWRQGAVRSSCRAGRSGWPDDGRATITGPRAGARGQVADGSRRSPARTPISRHLSAPWPTTRSARSRQPHDQASWPMTDAKGDAGSMPAFPRSGARAPPPEGRPAGSRRTRGTAKGPRRPRRAGRRCSAWCARSRNEADGQQDRGDDRQDQGARAAGR